jgi:RimJ/RimL family protein N-acetyltransferase
VRYLTLAEALIIAEAVTGIDAAVLGRASRLELLDSALHAPQAGFGDEEFYPEFVDKAAILAVRIARNHPLPDGNERPPLSIRSWAGDQRGHGRSPGGRMGSAIGPAGPKPRGRAMRSAKALIHIRPFTQEEAVIAASWRYPGELSIYDGEPNTWQVFLAETEEGHGYYAIVDDDDLLGFCCFGPEARVAGQPPGSDNLLDLGGGIRPDLVGQGLGAAGMAAVLTYARHRFSPPGFRTAIASFNRRSIVLCRWAGFRPTTTFQGPGGREFTKLVLVEAPTVSSFPRNPTGGLAWREHEG